MIEQACPVVVLDDQREELWQVAHGLGLCGLPVMPHLVREGRLEKAPVEPYSGVRLLFTDLHLLGSTQGKPEQYVSALIKFLQILIRPSNYLIVFWSAYAHEAEEAWALLSARVPQGYLPMSYEWLPKELASNACHEDEAVSAPARAELEAKVRAVIDKVPQLKALMNWEGAVSKAAASTTNELLRTLVMGKASIKHPDQVRAVLVRMTQEAMGYPYAPSDAARGLTQALLPMVQDTLERGTASRGQVELAEFLAIGDEKPVDLPTNELLPYLNNFFVHAEGDVVDPLDRGAVVRFEPAYLAGADGFTRDVGLMDDPGDWREAVCREFFIGWNSKKGDAAAVNAKAELREASVYAVELSAVCDHAQDKQRSQRFLFAIFVPPKQTNFLNKRKTANEAIYVTPEITLDGVVGNLLVSCRVFLSRPYRQMVAGVAVTRLRKDVVDELSHLYATHMRRPGKIAFF
jgi:hypothetical protein